jgi:beta-lactamase class A
VQRCGNPVRALHAACIGLVLITFACAVPGRAASPTASVPPTSTPVAQPLTRAAATPATTSTIARRHRPTPVARPTETPAPVATAQPEKRIPLLEGLLDGLLPDPGSDDYSLVLEDLTSGARTAINADQNRPAASLYKLGVAWAIMLRIDSGTLAEDEQLTIDDEDAVEPEPDGGFAVGDTATIRDALQAMLAVSSNASAHALLRTLGRDNFAQEMDRIGLHETRAPDDGQAVTSADDIARLLRLIATSPELSETSRAAISQGMSSIAPPDALRDILPESVSIFDKTGNLDDASNVGALLETPRGTVILVVIDSGVDPGDARTIIGQAGTIAYRALLASPSEE